MFRVIFLLAVPALVCCCTVPLHWTSINFAEYILAPPGQPALVMEILQDSYYDGEKQKLYLRQNTTNVSDPNNIVKAQQSVYMDFNTGTQWVLLPDGSCPKSNITAFIGKGIPPNAQILQNSTIGSGTSTLPVTTYHFTIDGHSIYFTLTNDNCVPVAYEQTGVLPDGSGLKVQVQYFGVQIRRSDPSLFHLPQRCH